MINVYFARLVTKASMEEYAKKNTQFRFLPPTANGHGDWNDRVWGETPVPSNV